METLRWIISVIGLLILAFFAYNLFHICKLMLKGQNSQGVFVCFLGLLFILTAGFFLVYGLLFSSAV